MQGGESRGAWNNRRAARAAEKQRSSTRPIVLVGRHDSFAAPRPADVITSARASTATSPTHDAGDASLQRHLTTIRRCREVEAFGYSGSGPGSSWSASHTCLGRPRRSRSGTGSRSWSHGGSSCPFVCGPFMCSHGSGQQCRPSPCSSQHRHSSWHRSSTHGGQQQSFSCSRCALTLFPSPCLAGRCGEIADRARTSDRRRSARRQGPRQVICASPASITSPALKSRPLTRRRRIRRESRGPRLNEPLTRVRELHRPAAGGQEARKLGADLHSCRSPERILRPEMTVAERRLERAAATTAGDRNERAHSDVVVRRHEPPRRRWTGRRRKACRGVAVRPVACRGDAHEHAFVPALDGRPLERPDVDGAAGGERSGHAQRRGGHRFEVVRPHEPGARAAVVCRTRAPCAPAFVPRFLTRT